MRLGYQINIAIQIAVSATRTIMATARAISMVIVMTSDFSRIFLRYLSNKKRRISCTTIPVTKTIPHMDPESKGQTA